MSSSRTVASMSEEESSARFNAPSSPDMASAVLRAAFSSVLTTAPSDNVPVLESPSHDLACGEISVNNVLRGAVSHYLESVGPHFLWLIVSLCPEIYGQFACLNILMYNVRKVRKVPPGPGRP